MKKLISILFTMLIVSPFIPAQEGIDIWTTTTTTIGRVFGMVIDPGNQSTMYACGLDQGVNKTTNSGLNWSQVNTGLLNIQGQAIAICQNSPQNLYVGTAPGANGGVYRTTNGGGNWTLVNTGITESNIGIQALLVHPNDPNIAWVCVFDGLADQVNGIYKTTNGGTNWAPATNGIGAIKNFLSLAMSPTDPNTIYLGSSFLVTAQTGPSAIYKSTDGGASWVLSSTGLPTDPTEINPVRTIQVSTANPNVVIAGLFLNTANGGFYFSSDAGANWTKKHNGLPTDLNTLIRSSAIRPLFDNQFYVGLDHGTITTNRGVWVTSDGGNNWVSFNGGTMLSSYAVRALAFNSTGTHTLYAGSAAPVGSGAGVYEYTFSVVPVELVSFTASAYGNEINLSWITATETNNYGFEIERSFEGSQFEKIGFVFGKGTSTELNYYSFTDNSVTPGNYSYRLKQIDFNGNYEYFDPVEVEVFPADNYTLMQNYPNPFNPSTRITFSIPTSGFVSLKVFDVLGNETAIIVDQDLTAGSYDFEFNASGLTSGVYYYTLKTGSFSQTKKMLLLK
jgi:photosystem II stability/assembly factor-like uncharacterized protein